MLFRGANTSLLLDDYTCHGAVIKSRKWLILGAFKVGTFHSSSAAGIALSVTCLVSQDLVNHSVADLKQSKLNLLKRSS